MKLDNYKQQKCSSLAAQSSSSANSRISTQTTTVSCKIWKRFHPSLPSVILSHCESIWLIATFIIGWFETAVCRVKKKKKKSQHSVISYSQLNGRNLPLNDCNFLFICSQASIKVAFLWPFWECGSVVRSYSWCWQISECCQCFFNSKGRCVCVNAKVCFRLFLFSQLYTVIV